ncbi:MAG: hypothetical protein V7L27_22640 [Nostoc sp.]|uniref:hypothetical protein n=1 Tax=Nostoc sp. TaxID=1180 RepID=UPI002FF63F5A
MNIQEKSVLAVTILLRKVARCILGTRNWVLTLLRRQRKKTFSRPAVGGWSFCIKGAYSGSHSDAVQNYIAKCREHAHWCQLKLKLLLVLVIYSLHCVLLSTSLPSFSCNSKILSLIPGAVELVIKAC